MQIPFADRLPKQEEVVTNVCDLAEQVLASQRKLAEEVVNNTAALLPGNGAPKNSAAK
jgi:hypothetical protein